MAESPLDENAAGYCLKLGSDLANARKYEEAVKASDGTIDLDPNDTEAWNNRGIVFSIFKRLKEPSNLLIRQPGLIRRNAEAWYNRGMVFCSLERYEDAVGSLGESPGDRYTERNCLAQQGVALKLLGRDTEARIAFACAGRIGTS